MTAQTGAEPHGRNERPIVVITRARSGSNLLKDYLSQIPGVVAFGEIFRVTKPEDVGPGLKALGTGDDTVARLRALQASDRSAFWTELQRAAADAGRRPAAKIFYAHVPNDPVWECFHEAMVVHLIRENVLESLVSLRLAKRTGAWHARVRSDSYDQEPVHIAADECRAYFAALQGDIGRIRARYGAAPDYGEITYRTLADLGRAQAALGRMLGIALRLRPAKYQRQRLRPLAEIVSNYADVADFDRDFTF